MKNPYNMKGKKETSIITTVTKAMAEAWVAEDINKDNRRKRTGSAYRKYVRDMKDGKWMYNGDSICFDWNGKLIDGQHRLYAMLETCKTTPNFTIKVVVATGIDPEAFHTIDQNIARNDPDILENAGYENASKLAPALKIVDHMVKNISRLGSTTDYTKAEILEVASRYHTTSVDLSESVIFALSVSRKIDGCPIRQPLVTALHYMLSQHDRRTAEYFLSVFCSGLEPNGDSRPTERNNITKMRTVFTTLKSNGTNEATDNRYILITLIRCWNRIKDPNTMTFTGCKPKVVRDANGSLIHSKFGTHNDRILPEISK